MHWYYAKGDEQIGPVAEDDIQRLAAAGKIQAGTLVWHKGLTDWQPFGEVAPWGLGTAAAFEPVPGQARCTECGRAHDPADMIQYEDFWVCADCKPVFVQKLKEGVPLAGIMIYGGFWIRFGAKLIDWVLLWIVNLLIAIPAGIFTAHSEYMALPLLTSGFQLIINAAYTTFFLGRFKATPGKMACGLEVVTSQGKPVSYARALGRHFAEMLSGMLLAVGYLMAAFDDQKRTLHDRICDTRVIRKKVSMS